MNELRKILLSQKMLCAQCAPVSGQIYRIFCLFFDFMSMFLIGFRP